MDVAGEQQIDVVNNIVKTRWSLDGQRLGYEMDDEAQRRKLKGQCGPCYPHLPAGQKKPEGNKCCNSCADVKALYKDLQAAGTWQLKWEEHPICQHEAVLLDPSRLASIHEGCNLFGFLEVTRSHHASLLCLRVPLHVAPSAAAWPIASPLAPTSHHAPCAMCHAPCAMRRAPCATLTRKRERA
tara:strand:- start:75 stop:626 length:552 start_codon:yes stop_codon:yes gene_type:complete